jgi:hypothetical protein
MAKKKSAPAKAEVNKSQAIRDYLKANRKAMPKAVVEALKAQGIEVSSQMVSTVKFNMSKKKGGKKRAAAASKSSAGNGEMISVSALLDAKKLVEKLGSIEKTKAALDALSKLS